METAEWLQIIGGAVGVIAAAVVTITLFLFKGWIAQAEKTYAAREARYEGELAGLRNDLKRVERETKDHAKETAERFGELSDRFVPRREMEAITRSIQQSAETNLAYLKKVDKQVENLTNILLTREGLAPNQDG